MNMAVLRTDMTGGFDVNAVKAQFPALVPAAGQKPIAFLDSAASAQKPQAVMTAMSEVMETHYANVHRGVYQYSQKTTEAYEAARVKVAQFLNARSDAEIIFTRNATEAVNLVAQSWGRQNLKAGDEVILTMLEHHANIVPWMMLKKEIGIDIKVVPVLSDGALDLEAYQNLLSPRSKLLAVTHMSNALGTLVPVADMTRLAKAQGMTVLVDAAQAVVHGAVDVQALDCDFLCFTGHKLYGPTGIGVLYGRETLLNAMPPYQGGGEMIETVTFDSVTYKDAPARFEAGTPAIIEAIGLGAAIEWFHGFDRAAVIAHESALLKAATAALSDIKGVTLYGVTEHKASILSFNIDGVHPHDAGTIFDQMGVAVRAGHHCTQPLMAALGVSATVRASFALYNTMDDVDRLVEAVKKTQSLFA